MKTMTHPRSRTSHLLAILGIASLLLAGCGSLLDRVVERGLEASTGTEGVSIDRDSGTISMEDSDGGSITIEADEQGSGQMTIETDDGETSFQTAPTTEVPDEIRELGVIPDGFTPATYHEQTSPDGHAIMLSGQIAGELSELLDDIEARVRNLGEPERFIMESGDGGGMGNVSVELPNEDRLTVSLLGDADDLILQIMLLQQP